jgi:protein-disulfide isomerase
MSRNKRSRTGRRQKAQQKRNFYMVLGVMLLVALGAGIYLFVIDQPPEVAASRLELEAAVGPEDAPVTVYEFGAYGCSSCRAIHQNGFNDQLFNLLHQEQYRDRVRFVFVNFPVINPFVDRIAAEAAQCVLDQGQEAFWTFHNSIYDLSQAEYGRYREDEFVQLANRAGLDGSAVDACLSNDTHKRTVQYHDKRARDRNVRGTPTLFVNDRLVGINLNQIESAIIAELNRS